MFEEQYNELIIQWVDKFVSKMFNIARMTKKPGTFTFISRHHICDNIYIDRAVYYGNFHLIQGYCRYVSGSGDFCPNYMLNSNSVNNKLIHVELVVSIYDTPDEVYEVIDHMRPITDNLEVIKITHEEEIKKNQIEINSLPPAYIDTALNIVQQNKRVREYLKFLNIINTPHLWFTDDTPIMSPRSRRSTS